MTKGFQARTLINEKLSSGKKLTKTELAVFMLNSKAALRHDTKKKIKN
jgi:hypothetical protein